MSIEPLTALAPGRRPPGWRAPGPPPAAPRERRELWPRAGERFAHLSGDWRILQRRDGHRWSLDDLVTAWFAAESSGNGAPRRFADLGCGIGAVLLMLAWRFASARGIGVEAQRESAALARRSIGWNGVEDRLRVCLADLRHAPLPPAAFDLVTATPPYLPLGSGRPPRRAQQLGCHFETRGGIEAYCAAAAPLLGRNGRFVFCHAAAQRPRVGHAAAAAGLAIVAWRDVVPRLGKAALFTVYAAASRAPAPIEPPPLIVRGADMQWTPEFRAVRAAMGMPS